MDIDFVIPWVNGDDFEWKKQKKQYENIIQNDSNEANTPNRFRDWNLLEFWFRSVEKFAPWVRKIHFLTWGHIPSFLKVNHPKLHIVNHKDFMPLEALPTYSSLAIEMCLHNIEGLSEHFVYFNDDMFLIKPVKEKDFFINGLPAEYFEESPCLHPTNTIYDHWIYNALCIINRNFKKHKQIKKHLKKWFKFVSKESLFHTLLAYPWDYYVGFPTSHLPAPFLKSTWIDVWKHEEKFLNKTVYSRFRTPLNVEQDLFRFWQFANGTFENTLTNGKYISINKYTINEICQIIKEQKYNKICINDDCEEEIFEDSRNLIFSAFDSILPQKSSYEK